MSDFSVSYSKFSDFFQKERKETRINMNWNNMCLFQLERADLDREFASEIPFYSHKKVKDLYKMLPWGI